MARGTAWTAPVVLLTQAAPALAASPTCSTKVLDWDTWASGTTPPSSVSLSGSTSPTNPTTVTRTITYGTDDNGNATVPGPNSGRVTASTEGGNVGNYLRLGLGTSTNPVTVGDDVTVTFTFSRPVTNLTFSIYDIDWVGSGSNGHDDQVYLSGSFTTTFRGSELRGAGTSTDPWLATRSGDGTTSNTHTVTVRYPGPVTSVSITYFNGTDGYGYGNSHIGVGDLSFCS